MSTRQNEAPGAVAQQEKVSKKPKGRAGAIQEIRGQLIQRRDALRSTLGGVQIGGKSGHGDSVDLASDASTDELETRLAEVESGELAKVEEALERIKDGTFGVCEGCGSNIPLMRLQAKINALMCIGCQREEEKR